MYSNNIKYNREHTLPIKYRLQLAFIGSVFTSLLLYTICRSIHGTKYTHYAIVNFWCNDLNGMNDKLRILFYSGLYILCYTSYMARPHTGDSPLQAYTLYKYTLTTWYTYEGLMSTIIGKLISNKQVLQIIHYSVSLCYICCIIGLFGQLPQVMLGILSLIQHGIVAGCIGTSHRWYVPVYSSLALSICNTRGQYSADYIISQYITDYTFTPDYLTPSLLNSGFSRKVILFSGLFTLFGGGISKLLNSGISWCNSECLAYYVSSTENGQLMWLKNLLWNNGLVTMAMAIQSECFELFSIHAFFTSTYRSYILIMAAILHLGIWLTMWYVCAFKTQYTQKNISESAL